MNWGINVVTSIRAKEISGIVVHRSCTLTLSLQQMTVSRLGSCHAKPLPLAYFMNLHRR